jgi:hypothetical protein
LCNFKICKCDCHGTHSIEQPELIKEVEVPIVKPQKEISDTNHPTPISSAIKETLSESALIKHQNKEEILIKNLEKSATKIDSQNSSDKLPNSTYDQGKVQINILNILPINENSRESLDLKNQPNKNIPEVENLNEVKKEVYLRRLSKYSHVLFVKTI